MKEQKSSFSHLRHFSEKSKTICRVEFLFSVEAAETVSRVEYSRFWGEFPLYNYIDI